MLHPARLGNLELRVWLLLRREPGLGVGGISDRLDRHRKSVARAVSRLSSYDLTHEVSSAPDRRDPFTGQLLASRYFALDPPPHW